MTANVNRKEKQPNGKRQQPVEVIRCGAIAASIWRRQTSTGFEYLDFSLSRSWKLKSGEKEGYSQSFFERNEEALLDVVTQACAYIRAHQTPSSGDPAYLVAGADFASMKTAASA